MQYLPYILMFAVVAAVIYGWGLKKSQHQQQDLNALLYSKCTQKIKKAIRKSGPMTQKEIEQLLVGTTAGQLYSKQKLTITEPEAFTSELLEFLIKRHVLTCKIQNGISYYHLYS
jgi:hypothetical protein